MKKKHALTVFVSPGSVVASERSGQQSQEQLLIFLGQEIDSDLHRSFCLENSNGKCCSACVCVWQLDRVPGQFRWVRVQTGGQSSGRNNERRAFENPEAERTGEHRLSRLNWLVLLLSETAQDTTGSVGSVVFCFFFACPAGGEGNKYTRGQEWDGGEFVQICSVINSFCSSRVPLHSTSWNRHQVPNEKYQCVLRNVKPELFTLVSAGCDVRTKLPLCHCSVYSVSDCITPHVWILHFILSLWMASADGDCVNQLWK